MRRLVAGALAIAALGSVGIALGARGYVDAAGDANEAPDITAVEVAEPEVGTIAITVRIGSAPSLPARSWVNLWFDTDSNQQTGDAGDEALVRYSVDGGIDVFVWDGRRLVERAPDGVKGSYAEGALRMMVPRSAVEAEGAFGLLVVTSRRQVEGSDRVVASDFAPDRGRSVFSGASTIYPDPAGDQDAAPDITNVRVSDAKSGWVTFAISTPNYAALPPEAILAVVIDADDNRRTGDGGADVAITTRGGEIALERWEPRSGWIPDDLPTRARVRQGPNIVSIDVHVSELANTHRFSFSVVGIDLNPAEEQVLGVDVAPNGGSWRYALVNKAAVRLVFTRIVTKPARPQAGKPFTVGFAATRSDTGRGVAAGTVGCRVLHAEKRVPARGRISGGAGLCTFVVPKCSQGSLVRGTVTVRSGGAALAWDFAFVVL